MEAVLQQQVLQQSQEPQSALQTVGIERQSKQQQLNMRGFDNIETLSSDWSRLEQGLEQGAACWPCSSTPKSVIVIKGKELEAVCLPCIG